MKNPEQISKPERQFIENFFVDEKFFSDTNEYLIYLLEDQYEVEIVEELPDDFNETIRFGELERIVEFTPDDIIQCCISDDRFPEDDDKLYSEIEVLLRKYVDFDKLNAEIPKLYYTTSEKMQITNADLIEWDN